MSNTLQRKPLLPIFFLFLLLNTLFISRNWLAKRGLDADVLVIANCLFFLLTLAVFFIQQKAFRNSNPNVFVRSVMAGMMIKMAVCIIAAIVYRLTMKNSFSKMSVFAAMFIYLLYLVAEVRILTKMLRNKNG